MKITRSLFIYNLLVNVPVCLALALAGALLGGAINWNNFAINFAISFVLAMLIGLFVPLARIGRWFTALFKVDNTTYTGNIRYRLLATLISSLIFYLIISPVLSVTNYFLVPGESPLTIFEHWLINFPFLFLVGFLSTLISDVGAYKAAHKIDETF
jgi:hypothetical protein